MKAIFLDRDGVIVRDTEGYIQIAEEMEPAPGGIEGCVALARAGFALYVVSNQQGVSLGLIEPDELPRMEAKVQEWIAPYRITAFSHATALAGSGDPRRKPAPGMLLEHGFNPAGCPMIGDRESDMAAALAAGAVPILVLTGKTRSGWESWTAQPTAVYTDLREAAEAILETSPPLGA